MFVVYRRRIKLLILYLRTSNRTETRAFETKIDILPMHGKLAVGQWLPSSINTSVLPNSSFNAEIDELRIWSRRSNPSLIHRNSNINPTGSYSSDLLHLFKFDNLSRHFVRDELTSMRFAYHRWYPAMPRFSDLGIDFQADKTRFENRSLEEAAKSRCRALLFEGDIHRKCKALGYGTTSRHYIECLEDIARSGNVTAAIHAVTSFVDRCESFLGLQDNLLKPFCRIKLSDYFPTWSASSCSQSCVYGVWRENVRWHRNGTSGTEDKCVCEHGYWGDNCTNICPGGVLNTCNSRGVCDSSNGSCSCYGNRISSYPNRTDMLPCSECLSGWKGAECSIAVKEQAASENVRNKISNGGLCTAYGNMQFTTFPGSSFSVDLQGMYLLAGNEKVQIYIISKACGLSLACRRIAEIFLVGRFGEASLTFANGKGKVVSKQRAKGVADGGKKSEIASFEPGISWQSLLNDTTIRLTGAKMDRIEIQTANDYTIIVFLFGDQMSVVVKGKSRNTFFNGICSYVMANSTDLIQEPLARFLNGSFVNSYAVNKTVFSQQVLATDIMTSYSWMDSTGVLLTNTSKYWQRGPGYMMYFSHNRVETGLVPVSDELTEWTMELWIHPGMPSENASNICSDTTVSELPLKQQILSIEHQGSQYLSLSYNGRLHIDWDSYSLTTHYFITPNSWTHVSASWRSYDGRIRIQSLSQCDKKQTSTHYNVKVGKVYSVNGTLVLGQYLKNGHGILENDFFGAVDELRLWSYGRSENDIEENAKKRLSFPMPGLLMVSSFDERSKSNMPVEIARSSVSSYEFTDRYNYLVAGKMNLILQPQESPPEWLPSTAPMQVEAHYKVSFRTHNISLAARQTCRKKFYTGEVNKYCSSNLPRTASFYYEACIADIAATENIDISDHHAVSFALLCSQQIDIPSCKLHGVYDGFPRCPGNEQQAAWTRTELTLLILGIVVAMVTAAGILVYWRKSSRPQVSPEDRYEHELVTENEDSNFFYQDPFLGSSFQSLPSVNQHNEESLNVDDLLKTSTKFLDDDDIIIDSSERQPEEQYKSNLLNSYEEIETEF